MTPSGLVIKGVMSCLWWRLCVPLPVIHFLSSCPYWHKAERKKQRKKVYEWTFLFHPFLHPTPGNFISAYDQWKDSEIKIGAGSRLFKHLISKSADLCLLGCIQFAYSCTKVINLSCVPSILEPFVLHSCLFLGSRDHRQFVCLSLSWRELVLLVRKQRGCRTSL